MGTTIRLEKVVKKFGRKEVIHSIDLETREGEFSFLLGPSGAGKTTILNLISGVVPLTAGNIYIGDKLVNDMKPMDRNVAIAFESYALYPDKTVFENMVFPLNAPIRKKELTDEQKKARVQEFAELLQISDLLDRYPRELSGGQRQRVALGRTLVRTPSIYLLDEPIAHLDAKLRHQMRSELKKLQIKLGIPFICTSPDQAEAVAMADRIFLLNEGRIEQEGSSRELYLTPKNEFVALMLGEPKMNITKMEMQEQNGQILFSNKDVTLKAPAGIAKAMAGKNLPKVLDLGIRPTDLKVSFKEIEGYDEYMVDFYQIIGEKFIITCIKGDTRLVVECRRALGETIELGQKVFLKWDTENFYFFDSETKNAL
ncbi:MAG: ABC transporter ATP-binding protein [Lachnospiraceae bacterium]|nr:ABC transporter ATP-binding protein [Lachnospiraceae bacterium]